MSVLDDRIERFAPNIEDLRKVISRCWAAGDLEWGLGYPPRDFDSWTPRETASHYLFIPPNRQFGIAIPKKGIGRLWVALMHMRRVACFGQTIREECVEIVPDEFLPAALQLIEKDLWIDAHREYRLFFHRFLVRAAEDPILSQRIARLNDRFRDKNVQFLWYADRTCWNFLSAWMLEQTSKFVEEGARYASPRAQKKRFQGFINLLNAGDSPFSPELTERILKEWGSFCCEASADSPLGAVFDYTKAEMERSRGGPVRPARPSGDLQRRPFFSEEIRLMMTLLIREGLTKWSAAGLTDSLLALVCAEWYRRPGRESVIKRFDYAMKKRSETGAKKSAEKGSAS